MAFKSKNHVLFLLINFPIFHHSNIPSFYSLQFLGTPAKEAFRSNSLN